VSLGHPSKFQRVSRLGSVTAQDSSSGCQPNFAALNRGRHIYSAERPSHWALAHILVCLCKIAILICFSFWASVCKTVCPMLSDCCLSVLSCLSVTLVYCGQTVGWRAGRPRPWPHCVRWRPSSPSPKGLTPLIFGPYLLWPNVWMDQDVTWYGGRP